MDLFSRFFHSVLSRGSQFYSSISWVDLERIFFLELLKIVIMNFYSNENIIEHQLIIV